MAPGEPLTGLLSRSYEHPLDRAALRSMESVPGVRTVLHYLVRESYERKARIEHHEECTRIMAEVVATRTAAQWLEHFHEQDLPVALVAEFQDLPSDPQILANGMAMEPLTDAGMPRVIRDPINVDGIGRVRATPAPDAGQHTDEILTELGMERHEISQLRNDGVI